MKFKIGDIVLVRSKRYGRLEFLPIFYSRSPLGLGIVTSIEERNKKGEYYYIVSPPKNLLFELSFLEKD